MSIGENEFLVGGERLYGVIFGLVTRDPQSATLTTVHECGLARVKATTLGQKYAEVVVAETSKAFTASKDTYVFLSTAGAYVYVEKANGAAKPTQVEVDAAAGANALYIAKVVTDGSRVVDGGVTDMRKEAPHGEIEAIDIDMSFEASEQGATYLRLPFPGRVIAIDASIYKALGATDTGTITAALGLNNKFTNITGGVITGAISAAIGTRYQVAPTAANLFQTGQTLRLTSAKTTAGGRLTVTVYVENRPK
jgi:hypothetical protein